MTIIYKTINGVEYAEEIYKNEIIRTKKVSNVSKELIAQEFNFLKNIINEELNNLSPEDKTKEEAKTEIERLVTIDLKNPVKNVGEI